MTILLKMVDFDSFSNIAEFDSGPYAYNNTEPQVINIFFQ